jgi:hypothetical protein
VLKAYVAAHDTQKPNIWAAREVTLSSKDHPEKVLVGIWDSGFDPAVYPGHLYTYPNSAPYPPQGLAFTDDGNPSDSTLYPLTPEQKQQYPEISEDLEALSDLHAGVETPVTESFKKLLTTMSKDDVNTMLSDSLSLAIWLMARTLPASRSKEIRQRDWSFFGSTTV